MKRYKMSDDNGNTNGVSMDDERRQRTREFILEHHQAKFHSDIEQLTTNVSELTADIKQIWRILKIALVTGRRVRSEFRQSQVEIKELREMGYEQDRRITAIIDAKHELQELAHRNLETAERHEKAIEKISELANRNSEAIRELQEIARQNEIRWAEVKEAMLEMSKAVKSAHERIDVVEEKIEK
jgi:methyl-accepting chemotaxis protein